MSHSTDIQLPMGGLLPTARGRALKRHRNELERMDRQGERAAEGAAIVNEVGRVAIQEVLGTAGVRAQAIALDPEGAAVYFHMWTEAALQTQQVVNALGRRLR